MDDKELAQRIRALSKAVSSEPAEAVIKLLEELKRDAKPTEEQLRVSLASFTRAGAESYMSGDAISNILSSLP